MKTTTMDEIRCRGCGSLLAKLAPGELQLRRGELKASVTGSFSAELHCYRRGCRARTEIHVMGSRA